MLESGAGAEVAGDHEVDGRGERREVVFGEPEGGGEEVFWDRGGEKEASDGLSGEFNRGDAAEDDAEDGAFAERNEDDLARDEGEVGTVGECAAATAVGFGGYYLEKHGFIIA